jgi:TetR/AcrR family transcriptional regulator, transcriptional repressor of bet genes
MQYDRIGREPHVPKQVDHQQRREEIADALCRLAARQGMAAVSLRHVAEEAGVSMGRVQHYFTTKDEMLLFAFRTVSDRYERRMTAAVAALGADPGPRKLLGALLRELLPLSEQAKAEAPVLAGFLARAMVEPSFAEFHLADSRALREFVARQLPLDQPAATLEAAGLLGMVDGLMVHLLVGQVDADTALATVDYHLDRILGGPAPV